MVSRDDSKLCGAKTKAGTCRHYAGFRTDHPGFGRCYRHSGSTPSGKKVAAREVVDAVLRAADEQRVPFYGDDKPMNSRDTLREELNRSRRKVNYLEQRFGNLEEARNGALSAEQLETLKAMHVQQAHLVRVSEAVIRLELDRLDTEAIERQGDVLGLAIIGFIRNVGLDPMNPAIRKEVRTMIDQMIAAEGDLEKLHLYAGQLPNDVGVGAA